MFTSSSFSPWHVLGCNSAWSQPGKTAFLCCAGNRKNIMSFTVTFSQICCCAAVSLTLLGERVDVKAPVASFPGWLRLYPARLIALLWKQGHLWSAKLCLSLGELFLGVLNWQSAKTARKLQVLNLSPPPSLLFSQPQGCNCSICMLEEKAQITTVCVVIFEL